MTKSQSILDELRKSDVKKVKVAITDLDGVLRGKYLHMEKFLSAAQNGFGFCNVVFGWDSADVCYDNSSYTGWHTGYPDATACVDLETHRSIPWENGLPFFLADFRKEDGTPLEICPRQLLKRVVSEAEKSGFRPGVGMEFEWFNFKESPQSLADKKFRSIDPLTPGMFGYSLIRMGQNQPYFNALMDDLTAFGVPIEGLHTETGPGVFEAAILYSDALEAADRAVLFKGGSKEIGARFGIMPSFMAKWNMQLPGCSGHIHQSLWSGDRNAFYDEKDPMKMSDTFKSYVAGLMQCMPEILPLFAPNVNSYKRLVDGYWAPTRVTWGMDNRTLALRAISGGAKSTRLETRVTGSDVNPYLAISGSIAAGLYGIRNKLPLREKPIVGNGYQAEDAVRLPKTLMEATEKMANSKLARELLGDVFVDHFTASREWEWKQYQGAVTDWELQRYFEII